MSRISFVLFLLYVLVILTGLFSRKGENFIDIGSGNKKIKKVICFLTVNPSLEFYDFPLELQKNDDYQVYVTIDDNDYVVPANIRSSDIIIVQLNNLKCENAGYKNILGHYLDKAIGKATARDKALYYFNKININYDLLWLVEEDAFFYSIDTLRNIDNNYNNGDDLLCTLHLVINSKKEANNWVWWPKVFKESKIGPPFGFASISVMRCSRKMMKAIDNYASKYGSFFVDESFFVTVAMHNGLNIKYPKEFHNAVFTKHFDEENLDRNYFYHPIKNISRQKQIRKKLMDNNS